MTYLGEEEVFTAAEVATAIKGIKSGKTASQDEIRPEMLKALTWEGIFWLTRVCQVVWKFSKTHWDRQTDVIIPMFKKGDCKQCTNYIGISLLSLPRKVYAKCLANKCREIVQSKLKNGHCGFYPGRSTTYQIFTTKQIFDKSWEYGKDLFACFASLEKAYDRVPREGFCESMALMVSCDVPLSHCTADRRFVFGKLQAIKTLPCGRWTLARVRFITSPFHCLHE